MSVSTDANCVQTIQTTEEKLAEKKKELENFQVFFTCLIEQKENKIILCFIILLIVVYYPMSLLEPYLTFIIVQLLSYR